jgi:hypothetical protein
MASLFTALPAGRYPLVADPSALLGEPGRDNEFDFGPQCLLDGIARLKGDD